MTRIRLTESEKLERRLMKMFEKHFVNYNLDFTKGYIGVHNYIYYPSREAQLMYLAYQTGHLKGKSKV